MKMFVILMVLLVMSGCVSHKESGLSDSTIDDMAEFNMMQSTGNYDCDRICEIGHRLQIVRSRVTCEKEDIDLLNECNCRGLEYLERECLR